MAAIAYLRVSTDEQAESGLGLDAQMAAIQVSALRLGESIGATFTDAGISGSKGMSERPGLFAAISALHRGDVLLVAKRDRIARDMIITATVEKEVARKGARLVSAAGEGSDDDGIGGMIQRRVLDLFAEIEREMIRSRTRAAMAEKKGRGERVGGIPYGYSLDADRIHLVENDGEREIMALVHRLRNGGQSFRAIVDTMNSNEVPTRKQGSRWHLKQVQNILKVEMN